MRWWGRPHDAACCCWRCWIRCCPATQAEPPLPAASEAGLELGTLERLAEPVVAALADRDAFLMAAPADRVAQLRIVELNVPDAFKALLAEALATYYEAPPVVAALGWRTAPPQPHGHDVAPNDDATWRGTGKSEGPRPALARLAALIVCSTPNRSCFNRRNIRRYYRFASWN